MLWNTLLLALRSIRRNLLRSFLTILGIVIGVAAVITMVTLGKGATRSVSDQIASMGSNLLLLRPGQRYGEGAPNFKIADVEAIRNQITSAAAVHRHPAKQSTLSSSRATGPPPSPAPTTIISAPVTGSWPPAAISARPKNAPAARYASSAKRCAKIFSAETTRSAATFASESSPVK